MRHTYGIVLDRTAIPTGNYQRVGLPCKFIGVQMVDKRALLR
jgi:hypothetical protein